MTRLRRMLCLFIALGALVLATPAWAAEEPAAGSGWEAGGTFTTKFQADISKARGAPTRVSLYNDSELSFFANYGSVFSLNGDIKYERTRAPNLLSYYPDRNNVFRSEAATLRQLYVTVRPTDKVELYAGKIHPAFGSAYKLMPGLFYPFATDYEQDERLGFGASVGLPLPGTPRLSVEVFKLDTTFLSNTVFSRPALNDPTAVRLLRYTHGQFGPSNTNGLRSVTAALRGGVAGEGLAWQVSATHEATDQPGARAENGFSIGGVYDPTGEGIRIGDVGVTPFAEYAVFENFSTIRGLGRHYGQIGVSFGLDRWTLAFAGGVRVSSGSLRATDHQQSVSMTYEVLDGLQVGAGLHRVIIGGRDSMTLAPALSYETKF